MSAADPARVLRANLLAGSSVLVAGAAGRQAPLAEAVSGLCAELGAELGSCAASAEDVEDTALEQAIEGELERLGALDLLVIDAASLFAARADAARAGKPNGPTAPRRDAGRAMLVGALQASWNVTRAVVERAFLEPERAGRIVYLAPAPGAGEHAEAARAGLENLARTLSIEWARHAITPVTIAPGERTAPGEVAALTAYLASPAGAYFSGCLLDLRGPRTA